MTYPSFVGFTPNTTINAVDSVDVPTPTDLTNLPDDKIFAFSFGATDHVGGLTVIGLEVAAGDWSSGGVEYMPFKPFSAVGTQPIPLEVDGEPGTLLGSMNLFAIRGMSGVPIFPSVANNIITSATTVTVTMISSGDLFLDYDSYGLLSVAAIHVDPGGTPTQLGDSNIGARTGDIPWTPASTSPDAAMTLDVATFPAGWVITDGTTIAEFDIISPSENTHYMAIAAILQGTPTVVDPPPTTGTLSLRKRQQDR